MAYTIYPHNKGSVLIGNEQYQVGSFKVNYKGDTVFIKSNDGRSYEGLYSEFINGGTGLQFVSLVALKDFISANFFDEPLDVEGLNQRIAELERQRGTAYSDTVPEESISLYDVVGGAGTYANFLDSLGAGIIITSEQLEGKQGILYRVPGEDYWGILFADIPGGVTPGELAALATEVTENTTDIETLRGYDPDPTFETYTPSTALADMAVNQGAAGYIVFNNFPFAAGDKCTAIKLNNPSGSARSHKVVKLGADGATVTDIETFVFPASAITEFNLTTPVVLLAGERVGVTLLASSIRGVPSGDIGSRIYNPSTSNWGASIITWGYSLSIEIAPDIPAYTSVKAISDKVVTIDATVTTKADLGDVIIEQKPITLLADMSANGGGVGWHIFNRFDSEFRREYSKFKLNNGSGSEQTFKVIKLATDGVTVTEIETFVFPASAITEFNLSAVAVFEPGELLGVHCETASFRNTTNPDIGSRYWNGSAWFTSPSTWGYTATARIIGYDTLKKASDEIARLKLGGATYPNTFFDFDADGGAYGVGMFRIYSKYPNKVNTYARFDVVHQLADTVGVPRSDLWRIFGAKQCIYNPSAGAMFETGISLLQSSESEYVVRFDVDDDSVGGFHGNELLDSVTFLADGLPVNTGADIALKSCDNFGYIQHSKMLKRSEVVNNELLAHVKATRFFDSGLKCENWLDVLAYPVGAPNLIFNSIYTGLFTTATDMADYFSSETSGFIEATRPVSGPNLLNELRNKQLRYYSEANNAGAVAASEMKYITQSGVDKTAEFNNELLTLVAWDLSIYCKYYRRKQGGLSGYPFLVGDKIHAESEIHFF